MATRRTNKVHIHLENHGSGYHGTVAVTVNEIHGEGEPVMRLCNKTSDRQFPVSWGLSDCADGLVAEANLMISRVK